MEVGLIQVMSIFLTGQWCSLVNAGMDVKHYKMWEDIIFSPIEIQIFEPQRLYVRQIRTIYVTYIALGNSGNRKLATG